MKTFKLLGYITTPNLAFETAIPVFHSKNSNRHYFTQKTSGNAISKFEILHGIESFIEIKSSIIRCVGDSPVFIQLNIGPAIISSSLEDYTLKLKQRLNERKDIVDPVLGLELAALTNDKDLINTFFRLTAKAACLVNPSGAKKWIEHHPLKNEQIEIRNLIDQGGIEISERLTEAVMTKNYFGKHGFAKSDIAFYCSPIAMDFLEIFDASSFSDPILRSARPITEAPDICTENCVLLVSAEESEGKLQNPLLQKIADGYRTGGSLAILTSESDTMGLTFHSNVQNLLARIGEKLSNTISFNRFSDVIILRTANRSTFKNLIRQRADLRTIQNEIQLLTINGSL